MNHALISPVCAVTQPRAAFTINQVTSTRRNGGTNAGACAAAASGVPRVHPADAISTAPLIVIAMSTSEKSARIADSASAPAVDSGVLRKPQYTPAAAAAPARSQDATAIRRAISGSLPRRAGPGLWARPRSR